MNYYDYTNTDNVLQIGCEQHDIIDWWEFTDDEISAMGRGALDWWNVWKPIIIRIIKASPAVPTKREENEK